MTTQMTREIRRSEMRGRSDFGWLDSRHSFSFGRYYDPKNLGFRSLRVINEDRVAPGRGFDTHPHENMEILTIVLDGAIAHRDTTGRQETLRPGEIQRMSAGTGILHSEFNASDTEPLHFLQIWITPDKAGIEPRYDQQPFDPAARRDRWQLYASPDGAEGSLAIQQDAKMLGMTLSTCVTESYSASADRGLYLHVIRGEVTLDGDQPSVLREGDAIAMEGAEEFSITNKGESEAEVLLFDLA